MAKEIFICAGDPSGDLHGSNLIKSIKKFQPDISVTSLGGRKMGEVSDNFLYDIVGLDVHGYFEPFKQYFKLKGILKNGIEYIKNKRPGIVVLVDFYGFNIRIAEYAHSLNIPVYYYISPQVWATRIGRVEKIKKFIERMMVIFPFEKEIYENAGVPVTFVGHPLIDLIPPVPSPFPLPSFGFAQDRQGERNKIGIFPGSRKPVVGWNLPILLETKRLLQDEFKDTKFIIFGLSKLKDCYKSDKQDSPADKQDSPADKQDSPADKSVEIVYDDSNYTARKKISLSIGVSGTTTLENALLGIPMVVMYRLPRLMYYLVKSMIQVENAAIVNLIFKQQIVPELIQDKAKPEDIKNIAGKFLTDKNLVTETQKKFLELRNLLGREGVSDRAAKMIVERIL